MRGSSRGYMRLLRMRLTGILSAAEDRSEVNVLKLATTPTQPVVRSKIGWQQKSHRLGGCTLVTAKRLASATCSRPSFSRSVPVEHNSHVKGLFFVLEKYSPGIR